MNGRTNLAGKKSNKVPVSRDIPEFFVARTWIWVLQWAPGVPVVQACLVHFINLCSFSLQLHGPTFYVVKFLELH
jgi:hypothetical protein